LNTEVNEDDGSSSGRMDINSDNSVRSTSSHARIKIKRAFSMNSNYGSKD
jgi:hypothetical protein